MARGRGVPQSQQNVREVPPLSLPCAPEPPPVPEVPAAARSPWTEVGMAILSEMIRERGSQSPPAGDEQPLHGGQEPHPLDRISGKPSEDFPHDD